MQKPKVVLIEDEEGIAAVIQLQADISGYQLLTATDGIRGYELVEREMPQVVLLDIMLPGQNGLDVCRKMKMNPRLKQIPIIMISAKSEETDVVLGLELGADDYVAKPFSPRILFSRIKAVLRRNQEESSMAPVLSFGDCTLDTERYLVKKKEKICPLTLSEFGILKKLAMNQGKVLTRNQLLEEVQGEDPSVVDRNVDVHIASLRKKLGPHFDSIETVRGVGYRFKTDEC